MQSSDFCAYLYYSAQSVAASVVIATEIINVN